MYKNVLKKLLKVSNKKSTTKKYVKKIKDATVVIIKKEKVA